MSLFVKKIMFAQGDGDATIVSTMICTIIGVFAFFLMATLMIDTTKIMDTKNQIYAVTDTYVQLMMSEGYLTDQDKTSLTDALADLGVTDIDFTGSTLSEVDYGQRVVLKMAFNVHVDTHVVTSLFSADVTGKTLSSSYYRVATSYH